MTIQVIITLVAGAALRGIYKRFRKNAMSVKEVVLWTLVWSGGTVLVWEPHISNRLAAWLGVGRGADAILYSAVVMLAYGVVRAFAIIQALEHALSEMVKQKAIRDFTNRLKETRDTKTVTLPDQQ